MMRRELLLPAIAIAAAGVIYLLIGKPGMADQPMARRAVELATMTPDEMTPAETYARLELLVRERPDDPQPHFFIGRLLTQQGRDSDAVRAYQSALRRDPAHVPSIVGLGDAFVRLSGGEVAPETARIYREAYSRDPSNVRTGFLIGVSLWQAGDREGAHSHWGAMAAQYPPASQQSEMLQRLVTAFASAEEAE